MPITWPSVERVDVVRGVVHAVLEAADPAPPTRLWCLDPARPSQRVRVLAVGKASTTMASAAYEAIGERISAALVVGLADQIASWIPPVNCAAWPADHPLPTERNITAANHVLDFVADDDNHDPILALISGGGSSMLSRPAPGICLDDLRTLSSALMRAGATVDELNTVRKHIETLKGGRLGLAANGTRIDVALLSDVIGDRIDTIASGPFAPDPTTFAEALGVLDRTGLRELAPSVTTLLLDGCRTGIGETPKPGSRAFDAISHTVLAGNSAAADAALNVLKALPLTTAVRTGWTGEANDLAEHLIGSLGGARSASVIAGEPTVTVKEAGAIGGPVQHAVLASAARLEQIGGDWIVFGIATDGVDGPTDAAGAAIDSGSFRRARELGLDPQCFVRDHQSYPLLKAIQGQIQTGPTGTNINDVIAAIRW